jgi:Flp pilus assembly protein TadG
MRCILRPQADNRRGVYMVETIVAALMIAGLLGVCYAIVR